MRNPIGDSRRQQPVRDASTDAFAAAVGSDAIDALRQRIGLSLSYLDDLRTHIAPLATALAGRARSAGRPLLIGLNGCQGSGKSTLAQFLRLMLHNGAGLRCAIVSIDDFYLTRREREQLARDVHPLLLTRGVPGTHDLSLANETLASLLDPLREEPFYIPVFDKATDDRAPRDAWQRVAPGLDLVVLEGWCIGCPPQSDHALAEPVNLLEQQEDAHGVWRTRVNRALAGEYRDLFARLDALVMLAAPGFECVFDWRSRQEQQLVRELAEHGVQHASDATLTEESLRRFIQFFERLTRHQLATLPAIADGVIALNDEHRMTAHSGPLFQ